MLISAFSSPPPTGTEDVLHFFWSNIVAKWKEKTEHQLSAFEFKNELL